MPLQTGFAGCDLTPEIGCPLSGFSSREELSSSIDDPLFGYALVLRDEQTSVAIVCADLEDVDAAFVAAVREQVTAATGMPGEQVMICATHTHWAPCMHPIPYVKTLLRDSVDEEYAGIAAAALSGAVIAACEQLQLAVVGWGTGRAEGISFNRRPVNLRTRKCVGTYTLEPELAALASREGAKLADAWPRHGHLGPRLSSPLPALDGLSVAPIDSEVPILRVDTADGQPLATLATFSCHGSVGKDDLYAISADYPAEARWAFEQAIGGPMLFAAGCSGDITSAWRGGDSRKRVGRAIGCAAAEAWLQIETPTDDVPLAVTSRMADIPVPDGFPSIEEAQAECDEFGHRDDAVGIAARRRYKRALQVAGRSATPREVWAARVGDMAIVGLPGEILVEIGLQIKQRSPFAVTTVIGLANDSAQYMCTDAARKEGGAEAGVNPDTNCNGPGTEAALVENSVEMLYELRGR